MLQRVNECYASSLIVQKDNQILKILMQPTLRGFEMFHNKPLYLNDRNRLGISYKRYNDVLNGYSSIQAPTRPNYLFKPVLEEERNDRLNRASFEVELQLQYLQQENAILQARLIESENKAQLAENKLLYNQLILKKKEYEQLIEGHKPFTQQLPEIYQTRQHSRLQSRDLRTTLTKQGQYTQEVVRDRYPSLLSHDRRRSASKRQRTTQSQNMQHVDEEINQSLQEDDEDLVKRLQFNTIFSKRPKRSLKPFLVMVRAAVRLFAPIRKRKKARLNELKGIHQQAALYKSEIANINKRQLNSQIYQWISKLFGRIISQLTAEAFIKSIGKEIKPKDPAIQDARRQMFGNIAKTLFQNIELATRTGILPDVLKKLMYLQLFRGYNKQPSYFVSSRTQYYNKENNILKNEEKRMIGTEFFVYTVVIENMGKLFEELPITNENHYIECYFHLQCLASLLQVYYMRVFKSLPKHENLNVKVVQKHFQVEASDKIKFNIKVDDQVDEKSECLILGLRDAGFFRNLFAQKQKLNDQLLALFQQFTANLLTHLQVENSA